MNEILYLLWVYVIVMTGAGTYFLMKPKSLGMALVYGAVNMLLLIVLKYLAKLHFQQ